MPVSGRRTSRWLPDGRHGGDVRAFDPDLGDLAWSALVSSSGVGPGLTLRVNVERQPSQPEGGPHHHQGVTEKGGASATAQGVDLLGGPTQYFADLAPETGHGRWL
jgi:hypothetical protein